MTADDKEAVVGNAESATTPADRRTRLDLILREDEGNDVVSQGQRILRALRDGPATTIELRRDLDVMQVSTRIFELRRQGYEIETHWIKQETAAGMLHRVGLYVLRQR